MLERAMLRLLRTRGAGKTICPSDVARAVAPHQFRPLMPAVRAVAAKLALRGVVEITQRGEVVSLAAARGPVRIRLCAPATPAPR
jgi:hypothetical protein